jgi:hypothetical protein
VDVSPPGGSGADCSAFEDFFGIILDFCVTVLVLFGFSLMDVDVELTFERSLGFC